MSPAVFVFDIQELDWGGVELLANVQKDQSHVPVIFLGTDANSKEIVKAMKQQAVDFLINPFTFEDLCVVIEAAMAVCVQNASRDHSEIVTRNLLKSLTARELEICFLMIRGYGNIEISEFNGSAPGTVKIHRGRVLSKMGVANLAALVKLLCSNSEQRWKTLG